MARLRASWRTSLPVVQQPRNPQSESIARSPYETSFKADVIRGRVTMTTETAASGGVGLGRGGRMSRQRKRDAVVRLLRGEDLEILSRALGVTAATLTGWRDTFVAAGEASLAT